MALSVLCGQDIVSNVLKEKKKKLYVYQKKSLKAWKEKGKGWRDAVKGKLPDAMLCMMVFSNISTLSQFHDDELYKDCLKQFETFRICCEGDDPTSEEYIKKYIRSAKSKRILLLTTYSSLRKVECAVEEEGSIFEVSIFDEAHNLHTPRSWMCCGVSKPIGEEYLEEEQDVSSDSEYWSSNDDDSDSCMSSDEEDEELTDSCMSSDEEDEELTDSCTSSDEDSPPTTTPKGGKPSQSKRKQKPTASRLKVHMKSPDEETIRNFRLRHKRVLHMSATPHRESCNPGFVGVYGEESSDWDVMLYSDALRMQQDPDGELKDRKVVKPLALRLVVGGVSKQAAEACASDPSTFPVDKKDLPEFLDVCNILAEMERLESTPGSPMRRVKVYNRRAKNDNRSSERYGDPTLWSEAQRHMQKLELCKRVGKDIKIEVRNVHGEMGKKATSDTLKWFNEAVTDDDDAQGERTVRVLCSCRALKEGVTLNRVDLEVYADGKRSKVDITQSCLRGVLHDPKHPDAVLPILMLVQADGVSLRSVEGESPEAAAKRAHNEIVQSLKSRKGFDTLSATILALQELDPAIRDEMVSMARLSTQRHRAASGDANDAGKGGTADASGDNETDLGPPNDAAEAHPDSVLDGNTSSPIGASDVERVKSRKRFSVTCGAELFMYGWKREELDECSLLGGIAGQLCTSFAIGIQKKGVLSQVQKFAELFQRETIPTQRSDDTFSDGVSMSGFWNNAKREHQSSTLDSEGFWSRHEEDPSLYKGVATFKADYEKHKENKVKLKLTPEQKFNELFQKETIPTQSSNDTFSDGTLMGVFWHHTAKKKHQSTLDSEGFWSRHEEDPSLYKGVATFKADYEKHKLKLTPEQKFNELFQRETIPTQRSDDTFSDGVSMSGFWYHTAKKKHQSTLDSEGFWHRYEEDPSLYKGVATFKADYEKHITNRTTCINILIDDAAVPNEQSGTFTTHSSGSFKKQTKHAFCEDNILTPDVLAPHVQKALDAALADPARLDKVSVLIEAREKYQVEHPPKKRVSKTKRKSDVKHPKSKRAKTSATGTEVAATETNGGSALPRRSDAVATQSVVVSKHGDTESVDRGTEPRVKGSQKRSMQTEDAATKKKKKGLTEEKKAERAKLMARLAQLDEGDDSAVYDEERHPEWKSEMNRVFCEEVRRVDGMNNGSPSGKVLVIDHESGNTTRALLDGGILPSRIVVVNTDPEICTKLSERISDEVKKGLRIVEGEVSEMLSRAEWRDTPFVAAYHDVCTGNWEVLRKILDSHFTSGRYAGKDDSPRHLVVGGTLTKRSTELGDNMASKLAKWQFYMKNVAAEKIGGEANVQWIPEIPQYEGMTNDNKWSDGGTITHFWRIDRQRGVPSR